MRQMTPALKIAVRIYNRGYAAMAKAAAGRCWFSPGPSPEKIER